MSDHYDRYNGMDKLLSTNLAEVGTDCISRQAAISAICSACGKIDCDKMDKCEKLQLPPANCSEFPNNSDTISRQAAIDRAVSIPMFGRDVKMVAVSEIKNLPPAQPEIIRCKDCKKREHCRTTNTWAVAPSDDWFCADAERRDDG